MCENRFCSDLYTLQYCGLQMTTDMEFNPTHIHMYIHAYTYGIAYLLGYSNFVVRIIQTWVSLRSCIQLKVLMLHSVCVCNSIADISISRIYCTSMFGRYRINNNNNNMVTRLFACNNELRDNDGCRYVL